MDVQNDKKLRDAIMDIILNRDLKRSEFAEMIGVDLKTVDSWLVDADKSSHKTPSIKNARKIEMVFDLPQGELCELIDDECVFTDVAKKKLDDVLTKHDLYGNSLLVYIAILTLPDDPTIEDILDSCSVFKKSKVELALLKLEKMKYITKINGTFTRYHIA